MEDDRQPKVHEVIEICYQTFLNSGINTKVMINKVVPQALRNKAVMLVSTNVFLWSKWMMMIMISISSRIETKCLSSSSSYPRRRTTNKV